MVDWIHDCTCDLCKTEHVQCAQSDEFDVSFKAWDNAGINTHEQIDAIKICVCFDCLLELLGCFHL